MIQDGEQKHIKNICTWEIQNGTHNDFKERNLWTNSKFRVIYKCNFCSFGNIYKLYAAIPREKLETSKIHLSLKSTPNVLHCLCLTRGRSRHIPSTNASKQGQIKTKPYGETYNCNLVSLEKYVYPYTLILCSLPLPMKSDNNENSCTFPHQAATFWDHPCPLPLPVVFSHTGLASRREFPFLRRLPLPTPLPSVCLSFPYCYFLPYFPVRICLGRVHLSPLIPLREQRYFPRYPPFPTLVLLPLSPLRCLRPVLNPLTPKPNPRTAIFANKTWPRGIVELNTAANRR